MVSTKRIITISGKNGYKLYKEFEADNPESIRLLKGKKDNEKLVYFNDWMTLIFKCELRSRVVLGAVGNSNNDIQMYPWQSMWPDHPEMYELKFKSEKDLTWYLLKQ